METVIRRATKSDAASIADFQIAMAMETESKSLAANVVVPAVESVFDSPTKGHYYVADIGGEVVGCLLITFEWSDWRNSNIWYIQSVFVAQPHRGKGIFKSLYQEVMHEARENDVMYVRLYVEKENARAQKTYEALGMQQLPYLMYDVRVPQK